MKVSDVFYKDALGKVWFLPASIKDYRDGKYGTTYAELLLQYEEQGAEKEFIDELVKSFINDDAEYCAEQYQVMVSEYGMEIAEKQLFNRRFEVLEASLDDTFEKVKTATRKFKTIIPIFIAMELFAIALMLGADEPNIIQETVFSWPAWGWFGKVDACIDGFLNSVAAMLFP